MRRAAAVAAIVVAMSGVGCAKDAGVATEPSTTGVTARSQTSDSPAGTTTPTTAAVGPAAPDASPYVEAFGDLSGVSLPAGDLGAVAVIASGTALSRQGSVPIMVRNNTGDDVGRIEVAGTARDEAGAIVESGSSQGFQPAIVAPGGIAYGYVYFDSELAGSTFDFAFTVDAEEVDDYFKPVVVSEINNSGDKLNGAVTNNTESEISGPISVGVICFDADGTFRVDTALGSYVKPDDLPAGAAGSFSIDGYGTTCPVGLVAASGYSR